MIRPFLIAIGFIAFLVVAIFVASVRRRRLRGDHAKRGCGDSPDRGRVWVCCNELCHAENLPHARYCNMCGMARSGETPDQ